LGDHEGHRNQQRNLERPLFDHVFEGHLRQSLLGFICVLDLCHFFPNVVGHSEVFERLFGLVHVVFDAEEVPRGLGTKDQSDHLD
jgi:hypothetical protein